MKICQRCVLPETFPGVRFDAAGVCNFCRSYRGERDVSAMKARVRGRFEQVVAQVRSADKGYYDCLLAFSGGKDSTYALWLLREQYGLRVLAVTLDNGFISPQAFVNIRTAAEALDAESLVIKPHLGLLRRLFVGVTESNPFPAKALERASACCNACIGLVKNAIMQVALEKRVPMLAYGWTPGQAPIGAALFKMNAPMLKQMFETRTTPLLKLGGEELRPYVLDESLLEHEDELPYHVNPMAFHDYTEGQIVDKVKELGWVAPVDTDGNSSNCILNAYAVRAHLASHGYHPYAWEVGGLVRGGVMTRDAGLASLADLGPEDVAVAVAKRLGLALPG